MLYIMLATQLNKINATKLAESNFTGDAESISMAVGSDYSKHPIQSQDEVLVLFDLSANRSFQWRDPEKFAHKLHKRGILDSVEHIYLIVSDIDPEMPIHHFARRMTDEIKRLTDKDVSVHIPGIIGYQATLIVPPSKTDGNTWQIYCLKNIPKKIGPFDVFNQDQHIDDLMRHENKKLVWEGTDANELRKWMDAPSKTLTPTLPPMINSCSIKP